MSDKKTQTIEQDDEFARRRRALLKKTGKLAVAAPRRHAADVQRDRFEVCHGGISGHDLVRSVGVPAGLRVRTRL